MIPTSHSSIMEARRAVMAALDESTAPFTMGDICDRTNCANATVGFFIHRLEKHGYLTSLAEGLYAKSCKWVPFPPNIFHAGKPKVLWSDVWDFVPKTFVGMGY